MAEITSTHAEARALDVGCRMSDVGCRMSDVGCRMSDVGCRMSDAVAKAKAGVTWQTGSQQRSDIYFRTACEFVRNGRLGKLTGIFINEGGITLLRIRIVITNGIGHCAQVF